MINHPPDSTPKSPQKAPAARRGLDSGRAAPTPFARSRRWKRFRSNRPALISLVILLLILLACLTTLGISTQSYQVQNLEYNRHGPMLDPITAPFGFDTLGRNLLWRCLLGGLVSLGIALAAAIISVLLGTTWGALAGWFGGRVDNIMMRIVDILFGLPYILMVILLKIALEPQLVKFLGPGHEHAANIIILFLAIGSVSWMPMARVIRGQVLSLRAQPFMEAARALGVPTRRILLNHLLPNLIGPIIVYATLIVPQAILQESFLSFLGIGIQPPVPTWGSLASEGVRTVNTVASFWWMVFFPCALLGLTLLCLNFIGDGLRDAFDPRTKSEK